MQHVPCCEGLASLWLSLAWPGYYTPGMCCQVSPVHVADGGYTALDAFLLSTHTWSFYLALRVCILLCFGQI